MATRQRRIAKLTTQAAAINAQNVAFLAPLRLTARQIVNESWNAGLKPPPTAKKCSVCGIEKSLSGFHRNKKCAGGHIGVCKNCYNAKASAITSENRRQAQAARPPRTKTCTRCHGLQTASAFAIYSDGPGKTGNGSLVL
jgi:hypothetical protein